MTEPAHRSIAAALAAFQAEMPTVAKTKTAKMGSYAYTYAALADVQAAAMPHLTRHGLSFTCIPGPGDGGSYIMTGRLMHDSGDSVEGSLPLFGRQAQELGSSITYARRYLFGALTGVVTDDDGDGSHAQGRERTAAQPSAPAADDAPVRTARRKPLPAPAPEPPLDGPPPADGITPEQTKKLAVSYRDRGITTRDDALAFAISIIGRDIASRKELTKHEASRVIDALEFVAEPGEPPDPHDGADPWAGAS